MTNGQEGKHNLIIECPVAQHPEIFTKINGSIEKLEKTLIGLEKSIIALELRTLEAISIEKQSTEKITVAIEKTLLNIKTIAEHAEVKADKAIDNSKAANIKVDFFYKFLLGLAGLSSTIAVLWHLFFGV